MDAHLSRVAVRRATAVPQASWSGENPGATSGQMAQAFKRAVNDHTHIEQRAYELYEERGRQDGYALDDWLKAEHEMAGAVSRK